MPPRFRGHGNNSEGHNRSPRYETPLKDLCYCIYVSLRMDAQYKSIRNLIGAKRGAKFEVPPYQRGYEWDKKHWMDLWSDLNRIGEQADHHYLGNIILLKKDGGQTFEIVDGQQRVSTISILIMAIRDSPNYERTEDNVEMNDILVLNAEGDKKPKLRLNDDKYISQYEAIWNGNIENTEGRIKEAYEFYLDKLKDLDNKEIEHIFQDICNNLRVVETISDNTSLAYTIFQSQNERGKEVSPQILAKARIHGASEDIDDKERSKEIIRRWDHLYRLLENNLGSPRFQKRLRVRRPMTQIIINSDVPTPTQVDKSELYRNFESVLNSYDDVYDFVMWFKSQVDIYLQLASNNYDIDAPDIPDDAKRHLQYLNSASTHSEVLSLAIYNNIEKEVLLEENFRLASILAMRMSLSSTSSADTRDTIYSTARKVRRTEDQNEVRSTLRDAVKEETPSDGEIREYLKANELNIRGAWNFRTLLTLVSIEEERRGPWKMEIEDLHIEHIAPRRTYKNPEYRDWRRKLNDEEFEEQRDKLGNLTLLLDSDHAGVDETSFSSKKQSYSNSDVKIAEDVSYYDDWTSETIEERTEDLADELIERWSLN